MDEHLNVPSIQFDPTITSSGLRYSRMDGSDYGRKKSISLAIEGLLAILYLISSTAMLVSLPLVGGSLQNYSDQSFIVVFVSAWFPVVFFLILFIAKYFKRDLEILPQSEWKYVSLAGAFLGLNGTLLVYASDPSRTAPYLQALLMPLLVPFTAVARYLILRISISNRRVACCAAVIIGLVIFSEPTIFGIDSDDSSSSGGSIMWPLVFAAAQIPGALSNVVAEKSLRRNSGVSTLSFTCWLMLFQFLTIWALFWLDFIPGFGQVSSPAEYFDTFLSGLKCVFRINPDCADASFRVLLFIASFCFSNGLSFLLLRHSEGALFLTIMQALTTPLGALFWYLFQDGPFRWAPQFQMSTGFTIAGLVVITPAVFLYKYFGLKENH